MSCCWISSCRTSMGSRLRSGWPARVTRRRWCWCRPEISRPTGGGWPVARSVGSYRRASCRGMRCPRWSRESVTRFALSVRVAAWPAGLVVGLGAEWLAGSGQSPAAAMADLAVGWTLIGCGLVCWSRRPQSRVGALLALAGFAWFLGTLARSPIGAVAALGTAMLFVHRGPLCHAIVGYPGGRPPGRLSVIVVVVCYVYAAAVPLARSDGVTIVVAVLVLAATVGGYVRAAGPDRRARVTAVAAAAVLAVPLAGGSVARLLGGREVLWAYQAALVLIAAGFVADSLFGRWAQ